MELNPDYVLIQFGHNDHKRYDPSVYSDRLRSCGADKEIRRQGGGRSSVTRRSFNADGKIVSNLVKMRNTIIRRLSRTMPMRLR